MRSVMMVAFWQSLVNAALDSFWQYLGSGNYVLMLLDTIYKSSSDSEHAIEIGANP